MARSDEQVVEELRGLYDETFGGKTGQRFLIPWSGLRRLYGFRKLFASRFALLATAASNAGLYLWDLGEGESGHLVAVIKIATVDRWRKVPRRIIEERAAPESAEDEETEDDDD